MKSKNIRPWLYITGAFLLLITAWTSLIFIAIKHTPERVPLETSNFNKDSATQHLD